MTTAFHAREPKVKLPYHLWTVAEFHQMAGTGLLDESDRVELIEGELVDMAPIGSKHAFIVNRLSQKFSSSVQDQCLVSTQNPIELGERSEPQPDVALLKNGDYMNKLPVASDVLLLVEVSDTTLEYDRDVKIALYARQKIPEVWLIDVQAVELTVYREPGEGQYHHIRKPKATEPVSPTLMPKIALQWMELLT